MSQPSDSPGAPSRSFRPASSNPNDNPLAPSKRSSTQGRRRDDTIKTKEKRISPEGAVLPDRGWPKLMYGINKLFGRPDKVPAINEAQRHELHRQAREAYKQQLIERLRWLSNQGIAPIMFFMNIKSAGKSSAAIGVGSVVKYHTQKSTLLLPATMNSATATAGQMAGISGNTISVSQFARDLKEFGTARTLEQRLPLTKWGLGVIVEDENSAADEDDAEATLGFMEELDVILPKVSNLILDGGNDNVSKRSLALQAARLSHVFNFVFMTDSVITQRTLKSTFMGYWNDTGIPDDVRMEFYEGFEHKDDSGWQVSTRDKIENSVVIATKADADTPIDFEYYMQPHQDARSDRLPLWHGTGLRVPSDKSIGREDNDGKLVPFDLDALELETYIAYLEIAVANFELTGFQRKVNIGTPMVASVTGHTPPPTQPSDLGGHYTEGGASS